MNKLTISRLSILRTFPNNRGLSHFLKSAVSSLGKRIQCLFQSLTGRAQNLLGFGILGVAVRVQFVSTCADHGGWEHLRCSGE